MLRTTFTLGFFLLITLLTAADSLVVRPIHERLLLVQYVEGTISYHGNGQVANDDRVMVVPLDVGAATLPGSYALRSADDAAYGAGQVPLSVARKTKPDRISHICDGWGYLPYYNATGCLNPQPDRVLEHYLYLELPEALTSGKTYTLDLDASLNGTAQTATFTWDDRATHSEALHVNNLGYVPTAPLKAGYLYHWAGDAGGLDFAAYAGEPFYLIDATDNSVAFTGTVAFRKPADNVETLQNNPNETPDQNFQAAAVWECDFSAFSTPGSYRLSVPGVGASFPFEVMADVYRAPYIATMRAFYHNRSGIAKTEPYTAFTRPADHNPAVTPGFGNRLVYTDFTICAATSTDAARVDSASWTAGRRGTLQETFGWYQDAGDWDAYPTHLKVPSSLMFLVEAFPNNFTDGELNIPESGNGLVDILDEARWLPRFYKRLKDETEAKGWSTGGVGGARIFGDLWGTDSGPGNTGRGSWQDNDRDWYVSGEEPVNTFAYAGMAAHLAYVLQQEGQPDPEGIDWLAEAEATYTWAAARYAADFACQDQSIARKKNYAAAALYRMTAAEAYHRDFRESWADMNTRDALTDDGPYGAFIYLSLPGTATEPDLRAEVRAKLVGYADFILLSFTEERAMRYGGNPYFPMLIGQATTPMVFEGIITHALLRKDQPEKAAEYLKYLYTTADYFLGTNPLNYTWITGLGERGPEELFHLDFWYDGHPGYPDGFVPYGPWLRRTSWQFMGPWDNDFAEVSLYPEINAWPGHERWFGQRPSPLVAEFTVHQSILNSTVLYAALVAANGDDSDPGTSTRRGPQTLSGLAVFPNPTTARVRLTGIAAERIGSVSLYNVGGQLVDHMAVATELSVGEQPPGIYVLRVIARDGRQANLRLVIE